MGTAMVEGEGAQAAASRPPVGRVRGLLDRRRLAVTIVATSAAWGLVCVPWAVADTKLPYSYAFTGLSGGNDGVRTPNFTAGGKVCIAGSVSLEGSTDASPDVRVRYSLVVPVPGFGSDKTVATLQQNSLFGMNTCFASQPGGLYYVRIEKSVFQQDTTLSGRGNVQTG